MEYVRFFRLRNDAITFALFSILILIFHPFWSFGQSMGDGQQIEDPTKWTKFFDKTTGLKIGDIVTLRMETALPKEYHLYSVRVPAKTGPSPTIFVLDNITKDMVVSGGCMDAITPEKQYDDIFETDVYFFHNKAAFIQKFKITGPNPKLSGALRYQVCKEEKCSYASLNIDQIFQVNVAAAAVDSLEKDTAKVISSVDTIKEPTPEGNSVGENSKSVTETKTSEKDGGKSGLLLLFMKAFAFGLASLITPCVFPMIPMTVTFFLKRSKNRSEGIRNAFIYSASLISIFVVLGLAITAIFGGAAIYNIATNPYVNIAMFLIVFTFGLSFLGMFEITLPSSWTTKLDQKSDQGGVMGIFFMALLLVVASFSCIGPIAGYILVDAAAGEVLSPFIGMLGYALGFALPFGLFAMFPGWLQTLPKSGGWLNSVKVTLGFLEIAVCMKFLSNADLVLQWHLLNREIFLAAWVAIFMVMGIYLLGKITLPHDTPSEKISVPRSIFAVSAFAFALYLLPGLFGSPLPLLAGILPPPNSNIGVRLYGDNSNNSNGKSNQLGENKVCSVERKFAESLSQYAPDGYCMFYDLDEATAYAKKVNKPLFVDFTGHSCSNCRQMEHKVWPDPTVKSLLTKDYVMVSLYVDDMTPLKETVELPDGTKLRTEGDKRLDYQMREFKVNSQPFYVLMDGDKKTLVEKGVGYTANIDDYVAYLKSGLKNFEERNKTGKKEISQK